MSILNYSVKTSKKADKFISKLQKKIFTNYSRWVQNELRSDPHIAHEGVLKKFKFKGFSAYKKRFGSVRIIYIINEEKKEVFIFKADNRDDVYR